MRLSMLVLCLLSKAALADQPVPTSSQPPPTRAVTNGPPSPEMMKDMLANPWAVEFIGMMGKWDRIAGYPSKEACEAAIPTLPKGHGGDGHCVYHDWRTGRIIGSQDPAWAGLKGPWIMEFTTVEGRYSRAGDYPSKAAGESAIPRVLYIQGGGGYNGHCIAWAGKHFADELNDANHVNPNTQKIHWAAEFLRADGKYERAVMFLSLEDCEAGLANAMNKTQSPPATQGHCIYLGDKSPFIRSQDPAWAGK